MGNSLGGIATMEKLNGYIYLAAPYSDIEESVRLFRFNTINETVAKLMSNGWTVYSPISHNHPIALNHNLPTGWDFWGTMDRNFIKHCIFFVVFMLPGWNTSHGIQEELKIAKEFNKPIVYLTADGTNWYYPRVR